MGSKVRTITKYLRSLERLDINLGIQEVQVHYSSPLSICEDNSNFCLHWYAKTNRYTKNKKEYWLLGVIRRS